jgi:hypothetical protein
MFEKRLRGYRAIGYTRDEAHSTIVAVSVSRPSTTGRPRCQ